MAPPLDIAYHVSSRRRGTGREYQVRRPEQNHGVSFQLLSSGAHKAREYHIFCLIIWKISWYCQSSIVNIRSDNQNRDAVSLQLLSSRAHKASEYCISCSRNIWKISWYFKSNIGNIWSDDQNNVVYLQLLSPRTQISHKLSFSISGGSLFLSVMMPGPLGWTGRSDWCRCHTHSLFMGGKIMSIHHHMWVTQRGSDSRHCHQDISKALPLWHHNLWSQQYAPSWCPL